MNVENSDFSARPVHFPVGSTGGQASNSVASAQTLTGAVLDRLDNLNKVLIGAEDHLNRVTDRIWGSPPPVPTGTSGPQPVANGREDEIGHLLTEVALRAERVLQSTARLNERI